MTRLKKIIRVFLMNMSSPSKNRQVRTFGGFLLRFSLTKRFIQAKNFFKNRRGCIFMNRICVPGKSCIVPKNANEGTFWTFLLCSWLQKKIKIITERHRKNWLSADKSSKTKPFSCLVTTNALKTMVAKGGTFGSTQVCVLVR